VCAGPQKTTFEYNKALYLVTKKNIERILRNNISFQRKNSLMGRKHLLPFFGIIYILEFLVGENPGPTFLYKAEITV
jgi:hypothetical protein